MQIASISEIKKELQTLHAAQLVDLCIKIAKYKKDNKEFLNYLLYQTSNETQFIENIKLEMTELFGDINRTNLYFAKKTIRKILRLANKNAKYSGIVTTNIELLMHFCKELKNTGLDFKKSTVLNNLYNSQIKKIKESLSTLHEDIQYDYQKDLEILTQ
jgi:gas vesicle protein